MPLPVIANTFRAALVSKASNGHIDVNVLHFRKTGALSYPGAIVIADPLIYALYNSALGGGVAMKQNLHPQWNLLEFRYTPLDGVSATTVIPHPLQGTSADDSLPPSTSLVITEYTALRGRAHRGRMFFPALGESNNDVNGGVVAAQVVSMQTQFSAWLASFAGSGVSQVVASYKNSTAEDVVSLLVRSVWHSQRRRAN